MSPNDATNDSESPEPEFLTVDEAADLLRINRKTLYEAIQRGEVPGVLRIRRTIRISRTALDEAAYCGTTSATRRPRPGVINFTSGQRGPASWRQP